MTRESTSAPESGDTRRSPRAHRKALRARYGAIAAGDDVVDAGPNGPSVTDRCCGEPDSSGRTGCGRDRGQRYARTLGYSAESIDRLPDGSHLGLGCGNPNAIAELEAGETVVDLGSGGGFDCFLAAREVGETGRVIGVDMTPEMVERARANRERNAVEHVEFRLGEIENLPLPDCHADVVISNCVINLSPSKARVFEEAFRVLKPGGRLAVSDLVTTPRGREALDAAEPIEVGSCASGAATIDELEETIEAAGFQSVSVSRLDDSDTIVREMYGREALRSALQSAAISAEKPMG